MTCTPFGLSLHMDRTEVSSVRRFKCRWPQPLYWVVVSLTFEMEVRAVAPILRAANQSPPPRPKVPKQAAELHRLVRANVFHSVLIEGIQKEG